MVAYLSYMNTEQQLISNNLSSHINFPDSTMSSQEPSSSGSYHNHTDLDILLGKEKAIFNHSGNKRFRAVINYNIHKYIGAPTKSLKSKLIRQLHQDMRSCGFRFLKKDEDSGSWREIEPHDAREKVSHALRDRVRELRKPTKRRRAQEVFPLLPPKVISLPDEAIVEQKREKVTSTNEFESMMNRFSTKQDVLKTAKDQQHTFQIMNLYSQDQKIPSPIPSSDVIKSFTELPQKNQRTVSLLSLVDPLPHMNEFALSQTNKSRKIPPSLFGVEEIIIPRVMPRSSSISNKANQDSNSMKQPRRLSMDSLFGGAAHDIADAQLGQNSRRNSMTCSVQSFTQYEEDMNTGMPSWRQSMADAVDNVGENPPSNNKSCRRPSMLSFLGELIHHDIEDEKKPGRCQSVQGLVTNEDISPEKNDDADIAARRLSLLSSAMDILQSDDEDEND